MEANPELHGHKSDAVAAVSWIRWMAAYIVGSHNLSRYSGALDHVRHRPSCRASGRRKLRMRPGMDTPSTMHEPRRPYAPHAVRRRTSGAVGPEHSPVLSPGRLASLLKVGYDSGSPLRQIAWRSASAAV